MKSNKGFTLIELMIVIAIIGILAAVAIPNFMNARDRARVQASISALQSIRTGMEMYMTDVDVYPKCTDANLMSTTAGYLSNHISALDGLSSTFEDDTAGADGLISYAYTDTNYTIVVECKDRPVSATRTFLRASDGYIEKKNRGETTWNKL